MVTDEVGIYNLALNAVGTRDTVAIPSERSREAEVCRRWFGPVRDRVLRAAPWPCAKAHFRLALLTKKGDDQWVNTDPDPGFLYSYSVPSDFIYPRYLAGFQRFTLSPRTTDIMSINTDQPQAVLCYTKQQNVIGLWDVGLQMAVAYALAGYISMPLHGKASRARATLEEANALIVQARAEQQNADEANITTIPDWIQARGFGTPIQDTRFYYPSGALFAAGEIGV